MTDRRSVCAPSAEDLRPDVPYVRGWMAGKQGTGALADALSALGLADDFPGLREDVHVHGDGVVHLGEVRPAAAELLTRALTVGLSIEMSQHASSHGSETAPPDSQPLHEPPRTLVAALPPTWRPLCGASCA